MLTYIFTFMILISFFNIDSSNTSGSDTIYNWESFLIKHKDEPEYDWFEKTFDNDKGQFQVKYLNYYILINYIFNH